jgi:hypothetical protein
VRNVVSVSASGSALGVVLNIAGLELNALFHAEGASNSSICYDFKELKIRVMHYLMKTRHRVYHLMCGKTVADGYAVMEK